MDATLAAWPCDALTRLNTIWPNAVAYPVAVAVAAAGHAIPLAPALGAYLHAVTANLISAGVRLIPLGQTAGQRVLAELEPVVAAAGQAATATPLDKVGSATFRADIASTRHETQYTRLFRS
jgi:urease accessory protein